MRQEVENAMNQIRAGLLARGCNVELLHATDLGAVHVNLSGNCCTDRLERLLTILDIEDALRKQVPGVKIVVDSQ
jgi:Fe-S cluster biogenesis protein NfuA